MEVHLRAHACFVISIFSFPGSSLGTSGTSPSDLLNWLRVRELPGAVDDFLAWPILPHLIAPFRGCHQAIWRVIRAAAELNRERTVRVRLRRQVVDRVRFQIVLLEEVLLVVDTDRPESVHGHVPGRERVYSLAVVGLRIDVVVDGSFRWIEAPARGRGHQVEDRVDFLLLAHPLLRGGAAHGLQDRQRVADLALGHRIPVRRLELARAGLLNLNLVLRRVGDFDIGRVLEIGQRADGRHDVARTTLLFGQGEAPWCVVNLQRREVILVDNEHRHEALAGLGQGDRDRPGVEVENGRRVQRITVHFHDFLVFNRCWGAVVEELAEAPQFHRVAKVLVGLGPREVLDRHREV